MKAMTTECRTISPNTCRAGTMRASSGQDDLTRIDLSVLHRIRPTARSLFNRQAISNCQQILLAYPVRTRVDSATESEGRSRPATPTPDDGGPPGVTEAEELTAPDTEMELTVAAVVGSPVSTGQAERPEGVEMELNRRGRKNGLLHD